MITKKVDRRVLKTKEAIRKSLLPLIASKGYDAITIQDVLDHANVGRSTFYAHFKDKDDLLISGFDVLMDELTNYIKTESLHHSNKRKIVFKFSLPLLEHADENRLLFKSLLVNQGGLIVQRRAFAMIVDLVKYELIQILPKLNGIELEIKSQFYAGAFFSLLKYWLEGKTKISATELDQHFQKLILTHF